MHLQLHDLLTSALQAVDSFQVGDVTMITILRMSRFR